MTTSIIARALDQLGGLLRDVTPEDQERSTPCSEWTVAELSDHIVNSTAGMATMAQGGEPDWSSNPHHDDPASALEGEAESLLTALESSDQFPEGMAAGELSIHAYDLATALGKDTADLDPEIAQAGYDFMKSSMKDDMRGDSFGPELQAPDDANAYQRIAAFAGREV